MGSSTVSDSMLSAIKAVLQSPESKIEHICRTTGDARRLQRVLRSNPDVNVHLICFEGLFPLHLAALSGHAKVCELLIFGGFNVNPSVKTAENGATPLHLAAWHGKVEVLELLLERAGVSIDEASADAYTALHYACWGGMMDAAKYLLKRGASVLAKSSFGYTPLVIAARSGMTDVVEHLLLYTSSEIDEGDINGCSALFHACWDGHRDVVRVLLKNGAKVSKADNRGRRAVDICKTRDIRELVQSVGLGASRSRRRRQGRHEAAPTSPSPSPTRSNALSPPLTPGGSYAALIQSRTALGSPRTISGASSSTLVTGESVGSTTTTLHDSPAPSRVSTSATLERPVVRSFLSFLGRSAATQSSTIAGSETDTATATAEEERSGGMRGRSPSPRRFHAPLGPGQQQHQQQQQQQQQQSTSELPVLWPDADHESDAGHSASSDHTDPAQVQGGTGFLAPSVVKEAWLLCTSSGSAKALYRLLRAYPALAADRRSRSKGRSSSPISVMRDAEDWTPLMRAAACGFTEIVQLLLLVGVDPSLTDGHGNTALHRAAWAGRDGCVATLLEKSDHSPEENSREVDTFNASSADLFESSSSVVVVDPINHAGNTPLHRAALHGHLEAVKVLAAKGASVLAADKLGWTALHHACSENHAAIVVFLLQSGADALAITKAAESPSELARDATIRRLLKAHIAWTMTHDGLEDAKRATRKTLDKAIKVALGLQADDVPKEDPNAQSASASASGSGSPSPAKAKAQGSAPKAALRSAIRTVAAANVLSKSGAKANASPAPVQPFRRGAPPSPPQGPNSPRRVEVPVAAGPVDAGDLLSALNRRKGRVAASDPPPPQPLPLPPPPPPTYESQPQQQPQPQPQSQPQFQPQPQSQPQPQPQPQLQPQPQPQPQPQLEQESPVVPDSATSTEARIKSLRERLLSRAKSSQATPRAPSPPPPPVPTSQEAGDDAALSAGAAPRKRTTFASDVVFNEPREAAPATPAAALSGQQRKGGGESQDMLLFAVVLTQVFSAYSNSLSRAFYRWKHRDTKTVGISGGTPLSSWRQNLSSTPNSNTKAKTPQVFRFDGFE